MRSFPEIDRDHEGMGKACVRHSHGCTYPSCECDRSRRIVPNVRGIGEADVREELAAAAVSVGPTGGGDAP